MDAKNTIYLWHEKAQVDYSEHYLRLYIAYNAWYRYVTKTEFDREAIARLKRRVRLWSEYIKGESLQALVPFAEQLASMTAQQPVLVTSGKWHGVIRGTFDYENLIEFWYHVRCSLFHGNNSQDSRFNQFVMIAYQTLNIFLSEIVDRMRRCITQQEIDLLTEIEMLSLPASAVTIHAMQYELRERYVRWHDIRSVDI